MNKISSTLSTSDVLVLDCQASGANPSSGFLMEIGWTHFNPSQQNQTQDIDTNYIESFLCHPPQSAIISKQVSRVTGLKIEDLSNGFELPFIREKLTSIANQIKQDNHSLLCPVVIHFARYEKPYLNYLYHLNSPDGIGEKSSEFPFEIICTHQIVQRLIPGLPRKGLRAIAGYFGYSVPEFRRSEDHIRATVFVWRHLIPLLEAQSVFTFDDLKSWLSGSVPTLKNAERFFPMDEEERKHLPDKPGVYRMLRLNGDILYVGKATSLKKRVKSYFYKRRHSHGEHILEMLSQAKKLDVTVTGSALEAALLETDEIKKHKPPYNVALKIKERQIVFYSVDLKEVSLVPDELHPLGPFASVNVLTPLSNIVSVLSGELEIPEIQDRGETDKELKLYSSFVSNILGVLPEYAPSFDCFSAGLNLFKEKHSLFIEKEGRERILDGLMELGKQLHLEKLEQLALEKLNKEEERDIEEEEIETPIESIADKEWEWTPESVSGVMEGIIRYGLRMVLRAQWFGLLSDSVLVWRTGKTAGRKGRLLVFRRGEIIKAEDVDLDCESVLFDKYWENMDKDCIGGEVILKVLESLERGEVFFDSGVYDIPFVFRKEGFDVAGYDRLRVFTSELRRLVFDEENRGVRLYLDKEVIIDKESLLELFKWV